MVPQNLADFLEALASAGELARLKTEISADLEIAALAATLARSSASDLPLGHAGPALLCERVRGHRQPVVANLFGSVSRVCRALGVATPDEFIERASHHSELAGKPSWLDRLKSRGNESALERFAPKAVKVGPAQQVVKLGRDIDLNELPALRAWPGETMRSITTGLLFSGDGSNGGLAISRVVLPIIDNSRLALVIDPYLPIWKQLEQAQTRGEKLPVAVTLGGPPALALLAELPLGGQVDLLSLVGMWGEQAVPLVRCRTQPVDVPAEAEMVLEGVVDPSAPTIDTGTFAAPTGQYHTRANCPVVQLTAITHRTNGAFPVTVFSPPPSEHTPLDRLAERLLLASVQLQAPEVTSLAIPTFAVSRSTLFVAVRSAFPQAARRVAHLIWGHADTMLTKQIVLVDESVDVHDARSVWYHVAANVVPERDIFTSAGPAGPFDSSPGDAAPATRWGMAMRWGIDATGRSAASGGRATGAVALSPEQEAFVMSAYKELLGK